MRKGIQDTLCAAIFLKPLKLFHKVDIFNLFQRIICCSCASESCKTCSKSCKKLCKYYAEPFFILCQVLYFNLLCLVNKMNCVDMKILPRVLFVLRIKKTRFDRFVQTTIETRLIEMLIMFKTGLVWFFQMKLVPTLTSQ